MRFATDKNLRAYAALALLIGYFGIKVLISGHVRYMPVPQWVGVLLCALAAIYLLLAVRRMARLRSGRDGNGRGLPGTSTEKWRSPIMNDSPFGFIILGAMGIIAGMLIAKDSNIIRGGDTFPVFAWAGWILSAFSALILCYGLQRFFRAWKDRHQTSSHHSAGETEDTNDTDSRDS